MTKLRHVATLTNLCENFKDRPKNMTDLYCNGSAVDSTVRHRVLRHYSKPLTLALIVLTLSACQTIDPYTGETKTSKTMNFGAMGAIAGAALGGLIDGRNGALLGAGIGALAGGAAGQYMDRQEAELRQRLESTGVRVYRQDDSILLEMPGDITFDSGSASLEPRFEPILSSVSEVLDEYESTYIDIIGHTDSTGGEALNTELSVARARTVGAYLSKSGILSDRIITEGKGESNPKKSNATVEGRSANRRVELILTPVT